MSEIDFNVFDKSSLVYVGKVLRNKIVDYAVRNNVDALKFTADEGDGVSISLLDETKALATAEIRGSASWTSPEQKSVVSTEIDNGHDVTAVASRQVKISFFIATNDEGAAARLYDAALHILSDSKICIDYNNGRSVYNLRGIVTAESIVKKGNQFENSICIDGFISTVQRRFISPSTF
jgi:hypothetical protein